MRMLKCYLANNREGHFVTADGAMSAPGQVWSCNSCGCRLVLMMNVDTLGGGNNSQLNDNALQDMSEIICDAGQATSSIRYETVTNMTSLTISRSGRGAFSSPFNQLKSWVQAMEAPVTTVRAGIAG